MSERHQHQQKNTRQVCTGRAYKTGGRGRHILPSLYAGLPSLVAAGLGAVRTFILAQFLSRCKGFANDREDGLANAFNGTVFHVRQEDGLFIPYGTYSHKKGVQHFTREGAVQMANAFTTLPAWVRKAFGWFSNEPLGVPVYIGHPDVPELRGAYQDKKAYGWVQGLEPQEQGMLVRIKWSEPGREMIENAHYRYYSPYWFGDGDAKNGYKINFLKSIGLTNDPNIPVPAIANDAAAGGGDGGMKAGWLAKLGLEADADMAAFENALNAAADELAALRQGKAAAEAVQTAAEAEKQRLENERAGLENAAAQAAQDAAAARALLVDQTLTLLVADGRVLPAEREAAQTRLTALANTAELGAEIERLGKEPPKLKTKATTDGAAAHKGRMLANTQEAEQRREAMANAIQDEFAATKQELGETHPGAWELAWQRLRKKRPELFGKAAAA